jgi:hypothetical protein
MGNVLKKIAGKIKIIRRKILKPKKEKPRGTLLRKTIKKEKK